MTFPHRPDLYRQPRASQLERRTLVKGEWPEAEPVEPTTWAIVWTAPSMERKAHDELVRLGYSAFLPMVRIWKDIPKRLRAKLKARRQPVDRPALSRYLFVGLDPERQIWSAIVEAEGVSDLIRCEGILQARLQADIARLRAAHDAGEYDEVKREAEALRERMEAMVGRKVRIAAGPFVGCEGTVESRHGKRAVAVTVGPMKAHLDVDDVEEVA
jgi:transcriptional antiterminator RfaH